MPTILSGNPSGSVEEYQDSAVKTGNPMIFNLPTPLSVTVSTALTAQQFLNGIVVASGASTTITPPPIRDPAPGTAGLATLMRGLSSRGVIPGDTVECLVVNGGASTITLAASGSLPAGLSYDTNQGTQTIVTGSSKMLMIRFTNGTPGAEAATIYA